MQNFSEVKGILLKKTLTGLSFVGIALSGFRNSYFGNSKFYSLPTISSGFTHSSNSSAVRYPRFTDSSFSVVPFS